MIGVCGTAMATLAAMLKRKGHDVQGSDQDVYPPMSDFLAPEGIRTLVGYKPEHITGDLDLVVVGNAISRGNPELEEVLDRKIRYCSLPEAIREHFLWGARSIVLAGTHGKTTTTSLTGWLLTHGGADPSVLVGGIARNFGEQGSSYRIGQGRDFVIEGDEYDSAFFDKTAKFLKYLPDIAVINNVEFDHADIYADFDAVTLAFRRLVNLVPRRGLLLIGADSPGARALRRQAVSRVQTFGTGDDVEWQAHDLEPAGAATRFKVRRGGAPFGVFELPLVGAYNVRNAMAAIAVATEVGIGPERIAEGLRAFAGVKRRLEVVGVADGVTVYDDFAHHPTAVAETLAGLRASNPDARIWAVFEPRSASSCRRVFQDDFARAFAGADEVLIAPVFRSTLPESERLSIPQLVRDLHAQGLSAREAESIDDIVAGIVREHRPGDLVVLMSNGGFGGIHQKLLRALGGAERSPEPVEGRAMSMRTNRAGRRLGADRRVRGAHRSGRQRAGDCVRRRDSGGGAWPASATSCRPTDRSPCTSIRCGPTATRPDGLPRARGRRRRARPAPVVRPPVRIPVCYGGELGPDLAGVAVVRGPGRRPTSSRVHAAATLPRVHARLRAGVCVPRASSTSGSRCRGTRRRASACRRARSASPACRPASIRPRRRAAGS